MSKSPNSKGTGVFAGSLTQTGINVDTWVQIPTGIDPGSNTVLQLESMEVYFRNAIQANNAAASSVMAIGVARSPVVPSLSNTDCFGMLALVTDVAGAPANAMELDVLQSIDLEPAITIQPYLYVCISTSGANAALQIDYRISYSTAKASQSETLLLLASGA